MKPLKAAQGLLRYSNGPKTTLFWTEAETQSCHPDPTIATLALDAILLPVK